MNTVLAIFKREFRAYFFSPIAYIFITVFLITAAALFFQSFFLANSADMRAYFMLIPWLFLVFVPAITMRLWAEEKKMKTLELLLSWPIKDSEIVAGKFLAALALLCVVLLLSFTIPVTIAILGHPDLGQILAQYAGAILLGAAYLSIGLWISSLTENQIVAFIVSAVVIFVLFIISSPFVVLLLPSSVAPLLTYIGMGGHYESISRGVFDSRDIIYYLSLIGFFLFLNVCSLGSRKWE